MAPRTPLLRPDRYFRAREPDLARGLVVAALVTAASVALVGGLGVVFTEKIDGTVMVDNPNRPSEAFCDSDPNSMFTEMSEVGFDCDAPAEIERDIDPIIRDALGGFYGSMLVGLPIVLLVTAVILHVGTALCGGRGGFGNSFAVSAWGFAPVLVTMPLGLAALWVLMDPVTITPETAPAVLKRTVIGSLQPWLPVATALNVASTAWGAVIWTFGLQWGRDVSRAQAAAVAAVTAGLFLLVGLL
ncbi:YIP1 family protein (plasmid) [Haloarcula salina]|uniref:YIP1 family protein n=1 Tax=Haloarcula salina TaxID=1429914 RepID=UPI003C6FCFC0